MHSMVIEPGTCPRCRRVRTVRFGATSFCFNCRLPVAASRSTGAPAPTPENSFAFSAAELARLRDYRAAVRAGFYSDRL
jgi:hypothetical protein